MLVILIPLLVAVVGLLMYALAGSAKVAEAGRLMFGCGVLVTLFALQGHAVRLP